MGSRKPDGLESSVSKVEFHYDKRGRYFYLCTALDNIIIKDKNRKNSYVPFCDFHEHRGLVDDLEVCQSRACTMLKRISFKKNVKPSGMCSKLKKVYFLNSIKYHNRTRTQRPRR